MMSENNISRKECLLLPVNAALDALNKKSCEVKEIICWPPLLGGIGAASTLLFLLYNF